MRQRCWNESSFDVLCRKELNRGRYAKRKECRMRNLLCLLFSVRSVYTGPAVYFISPNEIAARCEYIRTGDDRNKGINHKAAH